MADLSQPVVELTASPQPDVEVPALPDPVLSIVIVTFGTGPVVLDAIRSIVAHTDARATPYEVIVVDNPGAPRASADMLAARTRGVRLIRSATNIGFGPANDLGVSDARGVHVCLCNPDIVLPAGWLAPLLGALDDPVVGIAAPLLLNPDETIQEAGQLLYEDGCTAAIGGPEILTGDWSQAFSHDVDYASAACWLLRRSEFLGFNPRLVPAYFEDVDYALRLEQRGQVTRLVVDRPVVHLHGQSTDGTASAIAERSREVFRGEWAGRLTDQPRRPSSPLDALLARDRMCPERVAVVSRPADVQHASGVAAELARAHPRWRVSLFADDVPTSAVLQREGVEVCIGPPPVTLAARPGWATQGRLAAGRFDRSLRRAVARTQPGVSVQPLGTAS